MSSLETSSTMTASERERYREYVENRMLNGIKNNNAFDLLEAESAITRIGPFKPGDELRDLVLQFLHSEQYHHDFDLLRLTGYLVDEQICGLLEKRYDDLKEIWREQDVIRMAESYRTMLLNVTRRASELNALKVKADPFIKTLDSFFEKSFSQRNVDRFPQLAKLRDHLYALRQEGILSKDNILAVIDKTRNSIDKLIYEKEQTLRKKYQDSLPKPNRLIALYYCLLESLLLQESAKITVDEDFVDKIGQDFRAAVGHGTKRFVLNTLLKFKHPGFAEIAAEARYGIQHRIIEKVERKERGELEFKTAKVDLNEMQVFELYRTASEVIARNPNQEVFETLLYTYNVPSLLIGLRSLEMADLPALEKLQYLQKFFSLGTVNDYVFIRSVEVLAQIDAPAARQELARIIASRYGWRKVRLPRLAFSMINQGFASAITSNDLMALAEGLVDDERVSAAGEGEISGYPYESHVYETALDKLVHRFEKNPFHGINEFANHLFFKRMLVFITASPLQFAFKAKRRLLGLMRRRQQMSKARTEALAEELILAQSTLEQQSETIDNKDRGALNTLLKETKQTVAALLQHAKDYEEMEKRLRELPARLSRAIRTQTVGSIEKESIDSLFDYFYDRGVALMKKRTRNLDASARMKEDDDRSLHPVRLPVSTSAILQVSPSLHAMARQDLNSRIPEILQSMGTWEVLKFPRKKMEPDSHEQTRQHWQELEQMLLQPVSSSEVQTKALIIAKVTASAACHNLEDILNDLALRIYGGSFPPAIRLAMIAELPVKAAHAALWRFVICRETEQLLYAISRNLPAEDRQKLAILVPELHDLLS